MLISRYAFHAAIALAVVMIGAIIAQLTVLAGSPGAPVALLVLTGVIGYALRVAETSSRATGRAGASETRRRSVKCD